MIKITGGTVLAVGGVAVVLYLLAKEEVKDGAVAVGEAVNPLNDDNIFNRWINNLTYKLTGGENYTPAGWLYEFFNKQPDDPIKQNVVGKNVVGGQVNGYYPIDYMKPVGGEIWGNVDIDAPYA